MPSRVEDYEVLYTIGSGSYGKCQKIRRISDGKMLVWKELDYGTMAEAEKQMLVSEVNLLRELRHPNIVRYHDRIIDRTNTTLYIVMEYCEGGDLSGLISRCLKERQKWKVQAQKAQIQTMQSTNQRYLDEEFVLRVLTQLALALKECHRRRNGAQTVLHRDLKPANIFLDAQQNVKLGDFGLARILNHDTSFARTFVGTPYYMSPEQMNRLSYNEKSDIWSLGCLLYELCALSPPFTAHNQAELAEKIREGKFRRIPYRYSEALNSLLSRMLHLKDYLRPSVECILQSELITDVVAEENRREQDRERRRSGDGTRAKAQEPRLAELRLKEQQLQERERALKEREERLERREQELCIRERISEENLKRAETLMRKLSLAKQGRRTPPAPCSSGTDDEEGLIPGKKKVHFAGDSKENRRPLKNEGRELKQRLQAAGLRAQVLCEVERQYHLKSRQLLGIR